MSAEFSMNAGAIDANCDAVIEGRPIRLLCAAICTRFIAKNVDYVLNFALCRHRPAVARLGVLIGQRFCNQLPNKRDPFVALSSRIGGEFKSSLITRHNFKFCILVYKRQTLLYANKIEQQKNRPSSLGRTPKLPMRR